MGEIVDEERLKAIIESLLFAAGEPVSLNRLAAVLDSVPKDEIRNAVGALGAEYSQGGRGLTIEEVAGGYQLRTRKEFAPHIRKLLAGKPPRLSRSLLETVAIIAYRQPVTRPEIEEVRGVDCGGVLETLLERRLIRIAGRKEAPGRPMIYATTAEFLEVFGLKDLDSLPDLKEFQEIERARIEAESEGVETVTEMRPHESTAEGETEAPADEAGDESSSESSIESGEEKS
ncbi:MAG TPA: SMC-Scp complex subunit ScpB [Candidatus Binataceae bacterium]|nr:SMC-Scp complex subunit ScpB [Candidatus Binataceae bacterium]